MLRKILVPVTGRDSDRAVLAMGFTVARIFDAHVEALHVSIDPRDAIPMLGDGMSAALIQELMKAAEKDAAADAETARQHFEAARAAAQAAVTQSAPGPGMASGWFKTVTGRIDDIVPDEARLSDLVVFSQGAGRGDNRMAVTLESTLLDSSRPLLLTPERPPAKVGSTIAVAWNGSAECTRAVAAAMPFLLRAATVHILTAQTSATAPEQGGRLADYLAWHGIQAGIHVVKPIDEPVGSALVTRASELGSDFMVMGGYGHSRVREMILGGVTRYIFDHPSLPVLIAH